MTAPSLPRLTTGSAALDAVLGGGFPANSINVVMGDPGTGKTLLAQRLLFANAGTGARPALFLTTLTEPLEKVVRYAQQFSFFDEAKVPGAVQYESLGAALSRDGISALVTRVREAIKTMGPAVIVIDSFKVVHDLAGSPRELRLLMHELGGLLTAYETTAFLVGEYREDELASYPEFAIADGVVQLARAKLTARDERYLRVLKLRGSAYQEGLHGFRISSDGLDVFPRLVSPEVAPSYEISRERVPTGTEGLDAMMDGGPYRGSTTLLLGPTGAGKTTVGLQFVLEGIRRGERALYVNFEENPVQLAQQIQSLGHDPAKVFATGLQMMYVSPVELQIDSIVAEIFRGIDQSGMQRVVIDAIGDLQLAASDTERLHAYLYAVTQHFAVRGMACILVKEAVAPGRDVERLSVLADNIISLTVDEFDDTTRRRVRIIKARGIEHDLRTRELVISRQGVRIGHLR